MKIYVKKKKYYDNNITEAENIINNANNFAKDYFNKDFVASYTTSTIIHYFNKYNAL